jgi:hypothetical protein
MPRRAALSSAGRRKLATGLVLGGTGVGTVPSVPAGAVNVKSAPYNATGNGTTDDGSAIRSAITAAGTNGTVYFPTGTYKFVGATMGLPAGMTLLGAGPTNSIILHSPTTDFSPLLRNNGNNVTFHSLQMKRATAHPQVMFEINPFSGVTFDNCLLDGNYILDSVSTNHCLRIGVDTPTANINLLNSTFQNFRYALFQSNTDTGTTDGFTVRNCKFLNNRASDLEFNAPTGLITNILVENCTFDTKNNTDYIEGFGVGLAHCTNAMVQKCIFNAFQSEAVHIEDRCSNIEVAYNQFTACGQNQYSSIQVINASTDVRVRHNVIDGTGTKGVNYIAAIYAGDGGGTLPSSVVIDDNTIDRGFNGGINHRCNTVAITNNRFNPSVGITNGGSSGITSTNNTVSTALPAGF